MVEKPPSKQTKSPEPRPEEDSQPSMKDKDKSPAKERKEVLAPVAEMKEEGEGEDKGEPEKLVVAAEEQG